MSGMNRLKQQSNLSNEARWRLAAAYALSGQAETTREIISTIPETQQDNVNYTYTYGSPERDMAMILETYVLLKEKEKAARLSIQLANLMNSNKWMSTQTTAYCLLAMCSYAKDFKVNTGDTKIRCKINNNSAINYGFTMPLFRQDLNLEGQPKGTIEFENNSSGQIFVNLILKGQPLRDLNTEATSSGLVMDVRYYTLDNYEIDLSNIRQGTDFKTIVKIYNPGVAINNLALTQIFPSGWEIRNTRFEESGATFEIDVPNYRDIRDDRVYSYFDLRQGQTKQFVTVLHASFAGTYYMPAANCEAMYDYTYRASNTGQWVEVSK
jgi:uncharacterized protein YfaS (alpha-2-macroglobulin family)